MTSISSILATAFRVASFLFLRVVGLIQLKHSNTFPIIIKIPSPLLQSAIPALLSLYLLSANLSSKPARGNVNPAAAVLFSLRTPSRIIRWTNIVINSLIMLAFLDFCVSPYFDHASDVVFSRIGAVSDKSAKILVRYPNLNETIQLIWRESRPNAAWNKGEILNLSQENDWADTVTLSGLWPSTKYECESLYRSHFFNINPCNQMHSSVPTRPSLLTRVPLWHSVPSLILISLVEHIFALWHLLAYSQISLTFPCNAVELKVLTFLRSTCSPHYQLLGP